MQVQGNAADRLSCHWMTAIAAIDASIELAPAGQCAPEWDFNIFDLFFFSFPSFLPYHGVYVRIVQAYNP